MKVELNFVRNKTHEGKRIIWFLIDYVSNVC